MHARIAKHSRFCCKSLFPIFLTLLTIKLHAATLTNIRGERYCEVIFSETMTKFDVYSTFGLNNCPSAIWDKITPAQIKQDTGSSFVHTNGPRYWVIDGFRHTALLNAKTKIIGDLAMRKAGIVHLTPYNLLLAKSGAHYYTLKVERKTTWIYEAGKPVYELIDPEGNVYVMQSYSVHKHPQTQASLSRLGKQLSLPYGWHFKTGLLKKEERLKAAHNLAIVVQDDFLNTYQKAHHDFLS